VHKNLQRWYHPSCMSPLENKNPYRFMIDLKASAIDALYYVRLKDLYRAEQK